MTLPTLLMALLIALLYGGRVRPDFDRKVKVWFDAPQRHITAVQAAVFYRDQLMIGGGS